MKNLIFAILLTSSYTFANGDGSGGGISTIEGGGTGGGGLTNRGGEGHGGIGARGGVAPIGSNFRQGREKWLVTGSEGSGLRQTHGLDAGGDMGGGLTMIVDSIFTDFSNSECDKRCKLELIEELKELVVE